MGEQRAGDVFNKCKQITLHHNIHYHPFVFPEFLLVPASGRLPPGHPMTTQFLFLLCDLC